jgi:hypothetical protein
MGKAVHKLSDIDPESRTATCAGCGPWSRVSWRKDRERWICVAGNRRVGRTAGRSYYLKYRFGITADEYDRLLDSQGSACAICGRACESGRRLAVDHDHQTGSIRGLLCRKCNCALGLLGDTPEGIAAALRYLTSHQ